MWFASIGEYLYLIRRIMSNNTISPADGLSYLKETFGNNLTWKLIHMDPKTSPHNLLIRANIDVLKNNIITGSRNNLIKITTTNPKDKSTIAAQLVYCLWKLQMKTEKADRLKAYIETSNSILYTESHIDDGILDAIASNTNKSVLDYKFKTLASITREMLDILDYTNGKQVKSENGVYAAVDSEKLNDPNRNDNAIFQLYAKKPNEKSNLYRWVYLEPGSILSPMYFNSIDDHGNNVPAAQLIAHAWGGVGTGTLVQETTR